MEFLEKAKKLAGDLIDVSPEDMYVVWFAKTLQNWKALVSTDVVDDHYFEVTYNGDKKEAYVDLYIKESNVAVKDSDA